MEKDDEIGRGKAFLGVTLRRVTHSSKCAVRGRSPVKAARVRADLQISNFS